MELIEYIIECPLESLLWAFGFIAIWKCIEAAERKEDEQ